MGFHQIKHPFLQSALIFAPEVAWKRSRLLEKELAGLSEKIKPFIGEGMLTHQQACDAMVADMYVSKRELVLVRGYSNVD
jgi:hypothetical protein